MLTTGCMATNLNSDMNPVVLLCFLSFLGAPGVVRFPLTAAVDTDLVSSPSPLDVITSFSMTKTKSQHEISC